VGFHGLDKQRGLLDGKRGESNRWMQTDGSIFFDYSHTSMGLKSADLNPLKVGCPMMKNEYHAQIDLSLPIASRLKLQIIV